MALNEINLTSLDHTQIKQSLIEFMEASGKFDDFNFEGSAINTLIDLLVRNSQFDAFLAHMLANESFEQSAQLRGNVSAHAQKKSYLPKSCSAAKAVIDIVVSPSDVTLLPQSITIPKGKTFISQYGGQSYEFVCPEAINMSLNGSNQYVANGVEIYQGQLITNVFNHVENDSVVIPNSNIDMNTLQVVVDESGVETSYTAASSIRSITESDNLYYPVEDTNSKYGFLFGRNILGNEPATDSVITCTYVNCEEEHANGATNFIAASSFNGYANIQLTTTQAALGGSDRESIESIRFNSPRSYQTQERALSISDYEQLIKNSGYSVKSVRCWSGKGLIYFSAILDDELYLTRTVRDAIIDNVSNYYVGSVQLEYREPNRLDLDLIIQFSIDKTQTSKTRQDLFSLISQAVYDYDTSVLNNFGQFFNDSELISRIKSIRGVESVNIDTTMKQSISVNRSSGASYIIDFNNKIKENSVSMIDFESNLAATNETLIDRNGEIVLTYDQNGSSFERVIGSVDYVTGVVSFSIDMIQAADVVELLAEPLLENVYVKDNQYLNIDIVESAEL